MNGERWSIERLESIQALNIAIEKACLTQRQLRVLQMRFVENATLDDVAHELGLSSREGARLVESKILRKLRSPTSSKYLDRPREPCDKAAEQRSTDWGRAGSMLASYRWFVDQARETPAGYHWNPSIQTLRERIEDWLGTLDAIQSPSAHQRDLASTLREGIRLRPRQIKFEVEQETDGRWIAEVIGLPGTLAYGGSRIEAVLCAKKLAVDVLAERGEVPVL